MNYNDMFGILDLIPDDYGTSDDYPDISRNNQPAQFVPTFYDQPPITNWENAFAGLKTKTNSLYNIDGWISPYSSNNWGGTSSILQYIERDDRIGNTIDKTDPNKIFSSELNGLRALASDQQKIIKMVEKKLMESLTDQRKNGLTESDIDALSALSTARSTIATITKEQSNIKKNITEIRLKQYQINENNKMNNMQPSGDGQPMRPVRGASSTSILDNIFNSSVATNPGNAVTYDTGNTDPNKLIDDITNPSSVHLRYESMNPTTYVVIDNDNLGKTKYETYSESGELLPDYPNPESDIVSLDYDAGLATDELGQKYPIKEM